MIFFVNDTVTTMIYTLSLHDALPICISTLSQSPMLGFHKQMDNRIKLLEEKHWGRSEERFSRNAETDLVCRLLLEKKKEISNGTNPARNNYIPTNIQVSTIEIRSR